MTPPDVPIVMSDEPGPRVSSPYGHPFLATPRTQRLADGGAIAEYEGHGTVTPARMVRRGRFTLNYDRGESPELCDLERDP